ncbi:hypothetical protein LJ737_19740 [Hymenobacter sp. 15J16-1T3B]|uniref:hypothetical protein n=1 Tax=Hymenobacter sp. 15J16-1T3B TaxID=2886941 RepID=UPI001D11E86C|nr:hypothetical protein [Hymenobacter sp. 15J16-1T3B]MCC3159484.1 hypothetical protein [Hymenobacter sp. 15J16-1T3B]
MDTPTKVHLDSLFRASMAAAARYSGAANVITRLIEGGHLSHNTQLAASKELDGLRKLADEANDAYKAADAAQRAARTQPQPEDYAHIGQL